MQPDEISLKKCWRHSPNLWRHSPKSRFITTYITTRIERVDGFADRGPARDYTGLVPGYARKNPAKDVANEIVAELF